MPLTEIIYSTGVADEVVHPSPCVVSPTGEATFAFAGLATASFQSGTIGSSDELSFVDTFEFITRAQQSSAGAASATTNFNSTMRYFDPGWWDNVTFKFVAYCTNTNTTQTYDITLRDVDTGEILHTISVPPSTTNTFVFASAGANVTPLTGKRRVKMYLMKTASDNQLKVFKLRYVITQENPTKRACQIQLNCGGAISNQTLVLGDNRFINGGDTGFLAESLSYLFEKQASIWDGVTEVRFESVAGNTGALGSPKTYCALRNRDDGVNICENLHTSGLSATTIKESTFSFSHADFDDGDEFELYTRVTSNQANNSLLLSATIIIHQEDFTKTRLFRELDVQSLDGGNFGASGDLDYYFESTCLRNAADATYLSLFQSTTPSGAQTEVDSPNQRLTFVTLGKSREKTAGFTPVSGEKYYHAEKNSPADADLEEKQSYVLIDLSL